MAYPYSLQDPPPQVTPNPYILPTEFAAGDTFTYRFANGSLYTSSAGWSMQLSLRPVNGNQQIDITATVDGDFLFSVTPAVTALWSTGKYECQLYALNTGKRVTIFQTFVTIVPNLATVTTSTDLRSHARKVLDSIEATIEGRAKDDILDSQIDNTTFRRLTPDQLLHLHSYYSAKVRSEEAKARAKMGLGTGRSIFTRFSRP